MLISTRKHTQCTQKYLFSTCVPVSVVFIDYAINKKTFKVLLCFHIIDVLMVVTCLHLQIVY